MMVGCPTAGAPCSFPAPLVHLDRLRPTGQQLLCQLQGPLRHQWLIDHQAALASGCSANLSGTAMKSMNRSGNASSRACASGVRTMPFSRNKRASVAFLLPTRHRHPPRGTPRNYAGGAGRPLPALDDPLLGIICQPPAAFGIQGEKRSVGHCSSYLRNSGSRSNNRAARGSARLPKSLNVST